MTQQTLTRRGFMQTAGLTAAVLAIPGFSRALTLKGKPNLLVIHTDEHNFRTLGCYRKTLKPDQALMWGKAVVETPNIDWIASQGALCTKFYATTPVCSPSRASFVSGQYPHNTPVVTNNISMSNDVVTFAEILRRAGYTTGYSGKWHLDGGGKPQWGPERKFGFEDNRFMFNRGHWKQLEGTPEGPRVKARKNNKPDYSVAGADEKSFTTDWLADKTVEFIEKNKGKPFCYMVSIPDPHGPDTVRPPYDTMFNNMTFKKPVSANKPESGVPSWATKQGGGFDQSKYYGMVRCIDDNVGKILESLRKNGLIDSTVVVFTADHGDLRGEHGRHNKGVPLEGSAKIPFLVRYPASVKGGTVIKEALSCVDFLPTILALMGVKTAGKEEGRDASTLFTTGKAPADWKDIAFLRGTGGGNKENWLAAVTTRYKLVLSPGDNPWLLDLEKDPNELKNFISDPSCREIVKDLAGELIAYGKKYGDSRTKSAKIKADLEWCITGGEYKSTAPVRGDTEAKGKKKGGGKKGKKKKKE